MNILVHLIIKSSYVVHRNFRVRAYEKDGFDALNGGCQRSLGAGTYFESVNSHVKYISPNFLGFQLMKISYCFGSSVYEFYWCLREISVVVISQWGTEDARSSYNALS